MEFLKSLVYRGCALRVGAREVDLGLFEPVAFATPDHKGAAEVSIECETRYLLPAGDAQRSAEVTAMRWVDTHPGALR